MYYKRYELQWRFSLFFTASIIAGAFGGVWPHLHFVTSISLTDIASCFRDCKDEWDSWLRWLALDMVLLPNYGLITYPKNYI